MWIDILLVTAIVLGGLKALRAGRLLVAVLWLTLSSALIATILYRTGAPEIAAMELSVGAGLVTVMFVFSIAIAGEDAMGAQTLIPPALAWLLIVGAAVLFAVPILPVETVETAVSEPTFAAMLWEERALDVLVQIGLIFAGVLGILGLLTEPAVERKKETVTQTVGLPVEQAGHAVVQAASLPVEIKVRPTREERL